MNLDTISDKQVCELERLAHELRALMRKAKLKDESLLESLHKLELESGRVRRERYDATNSGYRGY
jgi:hypothetical protein